MRVVLDTNILLQAIPKKSRFRPIWNAYIEERLNLITTISILLEYEEMLGQKTSEHVAYNILSLIKRL